MSYSTTWLNNDGLKVPYGTLNTVNPEGARVHTVGTYKELRINVKYDNLPTTGSAVQGDNIGIPSGALIVKSEYRPITTFSHAVEIGTMTVAGVEVVKDGLHTTSTLATGTSFVGSGASIGDVLSQTEYVTVRATTTTPTAGEGELVITYRI